MKSVIYSVTKEKIAFVALVIMTVVSISIVVKGIPIVYQANKGISDGLSVTEISLKNMTDAPAAGDALKQKQIPAQPQTESRYVIESDVADTNRAGDGIISIFSPKEHKVALYSGLTNPNLRLGAARVSESALPGENGNCIIYGHRDSAFRCLKGIKAGDKVIITTGESEFVYVVEKTQVCAPADSEITKPYASPYLTLVTCFPFIYSGSAPDRYIVICTLQATK